MYVYNLYQEYLSRLDSGISENYDEDENSVTDENAIQNTDKNVMLIDFKQQQTAGKVGSNKIISGFYNDKLNTYHKYTYRVKKKGNKNVTKRKRTRKNRSKSRKMRLRN